MPAMKRSRNVSNPKRGARSGTTAKSARVPSEVDILDGKQRRLFMMCNKKHLSKHCAAGTVTNGAGIVPEFVFQTDVNAVTRCEENQVQLYWPFRINETCQSVLICPTAFGTTFPPDPNNLKSPWQQSLQLSSRKNFLPASSSTGETPFLPSQTAKSDNVRCQNNSSMTSKSHASPCQVLQTGEMKGMGPRAPI